ncbi:MAG: DUF1292 domain-containing protein [Tenericutes bacterium]|jgi:uncharacterized protein YrzB (UPF0473 family)|nr:DUF1292 domain-containing protein [Mycoplasmatota bacterium]
MNKKYFTVKDQEGKIQQAELLTIFAKNDTGKEYAVYTIQDNNQFGVYSQIIQRGSNGNDILVDIIDNNEKIEINNIVKALLSAAV